MIAFQKIVAAQIDLAFKLAGELVRECAYCRSGLNLMPVNNQFVIVNALFADFAYQEINGTTVINGDERCILRASEMEGIALTGPGDYLVETNSGKWREIISARKDPTGLIMTLQVRKSGAEDWEGLSAATLGEDRGDLTTTILIDDWQN